MEIIEFKNLNVYYETKPVLENLTLTISQGQHWAILGSNGCGKSTLMKLIQSDIHPLFDPNSTKKIFGKSRYVLADLKKMIGIISNDLHYFFAQNAPTLSAYDLVLSGFYSSFGIYEHQEFTQKQHQKVDATFDFLGIEHLKNKEVQTMSTGELRKCIIARALIHDPQALMLDEPTVGLDIKAQINFIKMLEELSQSKTIILVTHHIEEIFSSITHVALLKNGKVFKQGLKQEILTSQNLSQTFDVPLNVVLNNDRYSIEIK